jgi:hypothetical protein
METLIFRFRDRVGEAYFQRPALTFGAKPERIGDESLTGRGSGFILHNMWWFGRRSAATVLRQTCPPAPPDLPGR